jgi:hypothetical protein
LNTCVPVFHDRSLTNDSAVESKQGQGHPLSPGDGSRRRTLTHGNEKRRHQRRPLGYWPKWGCISRRIINGVTRKSRNVRRVIDPYTIRE